jgi:hypothetical protein
MVEFGRIGSIGVAIYVDCNMYNTCSVVLACDLGGTKYLGEEQGIMGLGSSQ